MQGRKVRIADVGSYRHFVVVRLGQDGKDDSTGKAVRCAYKDCNCSPDCGACEHTGSNPHWECNREQFVIGTSVD